jgi:hypothetical protein
MWRWENLPEGQPSLQHSTNQAFMIKWQPTYDSPLGVCQKASKGLSDMRNYILWSDETKIKHLG